MKQLLQMPNLEQQQHQDVIKQLARLLEKVTNARARASIVWVVGEYLEKIIQYAPDILRQLAKGYINEDVIVKMQILNLAAKLYIIEKEKTKLIVDYVLQLAKFDTNFDIRDKSRLLRNILLNPEGKTIFLQEHARELLSTIKPAPVIENIESIFRVGTISHMVNHTVHGYTPLYNWCTNPPETSIRDPPEYVPELAQTDEIDEPESLYNQFLGQDINQFYEGEYEEGEYIEDGEYYEYYEEGEYDEEYEYEYYDEGGDYIEEGGEYIEEHKEEYDEINGQVNGEVKNGENNYEDFYEETGYKEILEENNNQKEDEHNKNQYLSLSGDKQENNTTEQLNNTTNNTQVEDDESI